VLTFENFITFKNPIVLLMNNSNNKIKNFFKGQRGVKIYDKEINNDKILLLNPKIVIDINENNKTKGIYLNASRSILDKTKKTLIKSFDIPFIGKKQINKNKYLEIKLFKNGVPYIYIEFPSNNFDKKTILKTQLLIIKKLIKNI
jgi:hypothetical protein